MLAFMIIDGVIEPAVDELPIAEAVRVCATSLASTDTVPALIVTGPAEATKPAIANPPEDTVMGVVQE